MHEPKILLVGDYSWPWYQEACARALEQQGCKVIRFSWFDDFRYRADSHPEPVYHSIYHRVQYRYKRGPVAWRINRRLIEVAEASRPDIVWFYNVQLITPATVRQLRKRLPNATFCQYANDNPFSGAAKAGLWRNYLASIPLFDLHFTYRHSNIADYQSRGAKQVHLLRSYFIPEDDHPVEALEIPERFRCDVVFAGHYEDDGRVEMLEAICQAGFSLNIFGGGWNAALARLADDSPLRSKYPIMPATGADYRFAICGAKVALCFLSTLNHDTYTRRSFQIPAMRQAMLSQYTDDLASLFVPDQEVAYFSDRQTLLEQLARLIADPENRQLMADAGYERVYAGGHDVSSRMQEWLEVVRQWREA